MTPAPAPAPPGGGWTTGRILAPGTRCDLAMIVPPDNTVGAATPGRSVHGAVHPGGHGHAEDEENG